MLLLKKEKSFFNNFRDKKLTESLFFSGLSLKKLRCYFKPRVEVHLVSSKSYIVCFFSNIDIKIQFYASFNLKYAASSNSDPNNHQTNFRNKNCNLQTPLLVPITRTKRFLHANAFYEEHCRELTFKYSFAF